MLDDENKEILFESGLFLNKVESILLLVCGVCLLNKLFDGFVLIFKMVLFLSFKLIPGKLVLFDCFIILLFLSLFVLEFVNKEFG